MQRTSFYPNYWFKKVKKKVKKCKKNNNKKCLKNKQRRVECKSGRVFLQKGWKGCVLSAPEENWAKAQKGSIRHFESADWHSKSVEWYFWTSNTLSCSSAFWIPFLGFLEPGLALRRVSNPYSKIFTFFLDNLGLFSNNYLVDKYSKINLDKVQIIHNFIVIKLFLLFLCKQSYFKN